MRDLHKVREQEGLILTTSQVYALLGLGALALGLMFVLGFSLGRQAPSAVAQAADPLIPPDVENESVALLLARAAEEEAEAGEHDNVELQFQDILPNRTGDEAEAPRPAPVASSTASAKRSAESSPSGASGGEEVDSIGELVKLGEPDDAGGGAKPAKDASVQASADRAAEAPASAKSEAASGRTGGSEVKAREAGSSGSSGDAGRAAAKPAEAQRSVSQPAAAVSKESREKSDDAVAKRTRAEKAGSEVREAGPKGETGDKNASGRQYTVQVSSYQESNIADKLVRQLTAQGFSAYKVSAEVNGNTWYRVRVGAFDRREGAEQEMQRLKAARSELNPMITHR